MKAQSGAQNYTLAKFSNQVETIVFPEPFDEIPEVTATMVRLDWTSSSYDDYFTCTVSTVTKTEFTVIMTSNIDSSTDVNVVWEAKTGNSNLNETLNSPLTGFAEDHSHIYKVGNVKTLYLGSVINAMSYNTAYNAGTLPEKYRPIHDTVNFYQYGNGRYYNITINWTGEVLITCTTNSLPSDGKPHIGTCVTYV